MRNSDTLQGSGVRPRSTQAHTPEPLPQGPHAHVLLKETAMVSKAFSNSRLSASLLLS